jgi:hypothetical protein
LADAGNVGFYIRRDGQRVSSALDLFGLALGNVEGWIQTTGAA